MTREEAIEHLDTIGQYYSQDHSDPCEEYERLTKDELDAIYLAIKALEHPEQNVIAVVPCGDAISRQAVLKLFATNDGKYLYEAIRDLPSVTPQEPKTGHWTTVLHEEILFCSECHQRLVDEQTYIPLHYCPNCGAKMVEPRESEGT